MKLWLISQSTNVDYDTFDSAVVAAEDEASARLTHPNGHVSEWEETGSVDRPYGAWTSKEGVKCKYLGEAAQDIEAGVICASFNAG